MLRHRIGQFSAVGSDGKTYTITVTRHYMEPGSDFEDVPTNTTPESWIYMATLPGEQAAKWVTRIAKGSYKLTDSDVTLSSTDPAAV